MTILYTQRGKSRQLGDTLCAGMDVEGVSNGSHGDRFLDSRLRRMIFRDQGKNRSRTEGAARPVDERLAPTGAKRRPARLSDDEI